jgi:hypothetical protein
MSADAKVWQDDEGDWHAIHDGECSHAVEHRGTEYDLESILREVAVCMEKPAGLRWVQFIYTDGKAGLKGYTW